MMTTKGFKVTDADRKSRVGIATKSLEDLRKKTVEKFKLKISPEEIHFQTQDGTLVDTEDYFQTLHAQTLLIWVKEGERAATDAEILYRTIREVNEEYLTAGEKVQEFFTEKMKSKVFKLAEVLKGLDGDKAKYSLKCDHPEWFEGLDTNAKTKEDYMFRRAQDRVRTYYYKTREELLKICATPSSGGRPRLPQDRLRELIAELQDRLKLVKFNGHYFDRRPNNINNNNNNNNSSDQENILIVDRINTKLCTPMGDFVCQGRWDKDRCLYEPRHSINPYASKEARVIFQTWNLDHKIERSRSIVPAICDALRHSDKIIMDRQHGGDNMADISPPCLDVKAIFNDLFTVKNLKLVHIVCHDKSAHSTEKAGPYLLL